jgi:hypothetical protein
MIRRYGQLKVSTGRRHFNGMIRNNWKVCEYSERDIAYFEAPFNIKPLGLRAANKRFIETCDNFKPDVILIGHSDIITNKTLREIKKLMPQVPLIYRNLDPLWRERNIAMINHRKEVMDAIFITTAGKPLKQFCTGKNIVAHIPNATDPGMDDQDNSAKTEFERDLMFVGRGSTTDDRYAFLHSIDEKLKQHLRFEAYGLYGNPCIYGEGYEHLLATSKMGLNLNRFEGWPLYSSDRIAQLMGNGLLTFVWDKGDMRHFFTDEHVAFFKDEDELVKKAIAFHHDDARRQTVAAAGRTFYHEHFSGQRIVKFMVETALNLPYSHDYLWQNEVYK